ncbi:MAG: hypothetical protein EXR53_05860 [Dehalococcoidia bacterium]|nr:hypothetical protein [Dehalococcoidia bacterium]
MGHPMSNVAIGQDKAVGSNDEPGCGALKLSRFMTTTARGCLALKVDAYDPRPNPFHQVGQRLRIGP